MSFFCPILWAKDLQPYWHSSCRGARIVPTLLAFRPRGGRRLLFAFCKLICKNRANVCLYDCAVWAKDLQHCRHSPCNIARIMPSFLIRLAVSSPGQKIHKWAGLARIVPTPSHSHASRASPTRPSIHTRTLGKTFTCVYSLVWAKDSQMVFHFYIYIGYSTMLGDHSPSPLGAWRPR